jgi:hypothetical protein
MGDNITDDEIEYAFQMAKSLGVKGFTTSTKVSVAKRIAPFAGKHKMMVGYHGHNNTAGPNMPWGQGDTPIKEVLQMVKKEKYPLSANIEY